MGTRWVHLYGDGVVYLGACLVQSVTMVPAAIGDKATIYDGRDATSGKLFATVVAASVQTRTLRFSGGVPFDQGVYVDATDGDVETTVVFTPL